MQDGHRAPETNRWRFLRPSWTRTKDVSCKRDKFVSMAKWECHVQVESGLVLNDHMLGREGWFEGNQSDDGIE